MAAAPQKERNTKILLTDTRIAVGVFFQLLNSAVGSVVWALLEDKIKKKKLYVSKANTSSQEHLTGAKVFLLFHCNYKKHVS